jgi:outer membrane protein TolC
MADMAKRGKTVMDLDLTSTKQELTLEVTNTYYNILQALSLVGVSQEAVDDFSVHLTNIKHE